MADVFTTEKRSQVMAKIRSKGNKDTELRLIIFFREHSVIGWRRNQRLVGKPDFTFPKHRLAVFVDGCFWHGCPKHGRKPNTNIDYWHAKLDRNKQRDIVVARLLKSKGWRVIRLWEHDLANTKKIAKRLCNAFKRTKGSA